MRISVRYDIEAMPLGCGLLQGSSSAIRALEPLKRFGRPEACVPLGDRGRIGLPSEAEGGGDGGRCAARSRGCRTRRRRLSAFTAQGRHSDDGGSDRPNQVLLQASA